MGDRLSSRQEDAARDIFFDIHRDFDRSDLIEILFAGVITCGYIDIHGDFDRDELIEMLWDEMSDRDVEGYYKDLKKNGIL